MFVYIVADNEGNIADVSASLELAQEYIDASPEDLKIIRKEVRQEPLKVEPINFATFHYSNGRNQDEEFVCNLFTGNTLSFLGNYTEFNVSSVPLTLEGDKVIRKWIVDGRVVTNDEIDCRDEVLIFCRELYNDISRMEQFNRPLSEISKTIQETMDNILGGEIL